MVFIRRLNKIMRKILVFFCEICKKTNNNADKYWRKVKFQYNFCKRFSTLRRTWGRKWREVFLFFSKWRFSKSNKWYVDRGCNNHITRYEKNFLSINSSVSTKVTMGNEDLDYVKGKVTISINIKRSGKQTHDVLYVPNFQENFLSVGQLMKILFACA